MTTTAATWFYRPPEKKPYLIAERLRTSLWDQRFGDVWLDTIRAEPPILLQGSYQGAPLKLEWEPGQWLRLAIKADGPHLAKGFENVLHRKPFLRYADGEGHNVWEWWMDDTAGEDRWQTIQGKPLFVSPVRLKKQENA